MQAAHTAAGPSLSCKANQARPARVRRRAGCGARASSAESLSRGITHLQLLRQPRNRFPLHICRRFLSSGLERSGLTAPRSNDAELRAFYASASNSWPRALLEHNRGSLTQLQKLLLRAVGTRERMAQAASQNAPPPRPLGEFMRAAGLTNGRYRSRASDTASSQHRSNARCGECAHMRALLEGDLKPHSHQERSCRCRAFGQEHG